MFRDRIKAVYENLTPSFRKLADFVLDKQLDAAFMTATEMALRMKVDAATVVRFAQTIGYSGFRELIKEVQKVVNEELTASHTGTLDGSSDDQALLQSLLENVRHDISLAQARLTGQANAILPALADAERIWVVGQGCCAHLAGTCAASLRDVGFPAIRVSPDLVEAAAILKDISSSGVVIGLSLTGVDLQVADIVKFARARGGKTIVLSGSEVAKVALAGEIVVVCPGPTLPHAPSFAGLAAMIDALAQALATRYPDKAAAMTESSRGNYLELLALQAQSASDVGIQRIQRGF